ncbi:MAG: hypothetical protein ACD_22C00257G0005 [uncultured bacterium]|nr:MAG: hypothetical protein ACD_22C00257G0005 [uncultured bacterium]
MNIKFRITIIIVTLLVAVCFTGVALAGSSQTTVNVPVDDCWTGEPEVFTSTVVLLHPTCGFVIEWETTDGQGWKLYGVNAELPGTKIILPQETTWAQVWRMSTWDVEYQRPYWADFQNDLAVSRAGQIGIPVSEIPTDTWPAEALIGLDFCPEDATQAALMYGGDSANWTRITGYPGQFCGWYFESNLSRDVYIPEGSVFTVYNITGDLNYPGPWHIETKLGSMWLGDVVPQPMLFVEAPSKALVGSSVTVEFSANWGDTFSFWFNPQWEVPTFAYEVSGCENISPYEPEPFFVCSTGVDHTLIITATQATDINISFGVTSNFFGDTIAEKDVKIQVRYVTYLPIVNR